MAAHRAWALPEGLLERTPHVREVGIAAIQRDFGKPLHTGRHPVPRQTQTREADFLRGDVPVHAWWIPDSLEIDPEVKAKAAELTFWLESGLRLNDPDDGE